MMLEKIKTIRPSSIRQLIGTVIAIIGLGIAFAYLYEDLGELFQSGIQIDPRMVLFAAIIQLIGLFFAILTWGSILRGFGANASVRDHFRIYLYSSLGWIIPGGIWNIIMRSTLYDGDEASPEQVAAASLCERIFVGISALILYLLTLLYRPEVNTFRQPGLAFLLATIFLISIQPRVFNRLYSYANRLSGNRLKQFTLKFKSSDLLRWLLIEALVLVLGGASLFLLLRSFEDVSISAIPFVISAWAAASVASNLFSWIPGTLIFHGGLFVLVLSSIVSIPTAILFAFLVRIWTTISIIFFAISAWLVLDLPKKSAFR